MKQNQGPMFLLKSYSTCFGPCPVSCFIHAEIPTSCGSQLHSAHKHEDSRPVRTRRWWCWLPMTSSAANQEKAPEQITHSITPSFTLSLNFPGKPSGGMSLLSMVCPGPLAHQNLKHMLPFLQHNVGAVDGPHCAGARISGGVQKLLTKGYRSRSRTQSHLTSYECNKRRQRIAGQSGQYPQLRCWKSQRNKIRSSERGEMGSLGTHHPDSCRGVRLTQPPDPAPEVTHGHSQRWPHPRSCVWGHMSTVSRVTPLPDTEPGVTRPQVSTWMGLKGSFLREVSQHRKTTVCDVPSRHIINRHTKYQIYEPKETLKFQTQRVLRNRKRKKKRMWRAWKIRRSEHRHRKLYV